MYNKGYVPEFNPHNDAFEKVSPGPNITSEVDTTDVIEKNSVGYHASCTAATEKDGDPECGS
jgi:hypothetical protein